MSRIVFLSYLILLLSPMAGGQVKETLYKDLRLHSFSDKDYPTLRIGLDYIDFTDSTASNKLILWENGKEVKVNSIKKAKLKENIALNFLIFSGDTSGYAPYLRSLETVDAEGLEFNVFSQIDSSFNLVNPGDWLKTVQTERKGPDSVFFSLFLRSLSSEFDRPDDVIILMTETLDQATAELLNKSINRINDPNPPFFILYYQKSKLTSFIPGFFKNDTVKILYSQFQPGKTEPAEILEFIDPIRKASSLVEWQATEPLSLVRDRNIQVSAGGMDEKIHLVLSDEVVQNYYIRVTVKSADSLIRLGKFEECVTLLNNRYLRVNDAAIVKKAEENLDSFALKLIGQRDKTPFTTFYITESINNVPLSRGYQKSKLNHLKEFYKLVDMKDSLHNERLKIAEAITKISPDDSWSKYILHWSKGKKYSSDKKYWNALDEYKIAIGIRTDERITNEITRLISICLTEAFDQKDWKKVKQYGATFYNFFQKSFILRCQYGIASYESSDFTEASAQMEWVVFNWEDNPVLKWEEAFNYLLQSYTFTFRFEEAITLSQRIFREKQNQAALQIALLNLRLKWIKPIVDAFSVWLEIVPAQNQTNGSINLSRIVLPQYLSSVLIYDNQGSLNTRIYENKKATVLTAGVPVLSGSISSVIFENENQLITGPSIKLRNVVFLLNNKLLDEQEKSLLSLITKEPSNNQAWQQLFSYEEKTGVKVFSQMLAALTGSSMQYSGDVNTDKYWNAIRNCKEIEYLVSHKRDGAVDSPNGFDRKKLELQEEDWQKSSKTTSLFFAETKYNNTAIYDISNPVFGKTGWEGTLRVGIKK